MAQTLISSTLSGKAVYSDSAWQEFPTSNYCRCNMQKMSGRARQTLLEIYDKVFRFRQCS